MTYIHRHSKMSSHPSLTKFIWTVINTRCLLGGAFRHAVVLVTDTVVSGVAAMQTKAEVAQTQPVTNVKFLPDGSRLE